MSHVTRRKGLSSQGRFFVIFFPVNRIDRWTITNVDYFYIPTYWKFCSIALQRSMYPSSFTSSTMFFIVLKRTREENAQESESHSTRSPAHAEVSHRWWWWWCRGEAWGSFRKDVRNGIPLAAIRSSQPRINGGSE